MSRLPELGSESDEGQPSHSIRIERQPDGSILYEVPPDHEPPSFKIPVGEGRVVDIELPPNPPIRVVDGREFPQLDVPFVLVQFEVVTRDWRRGWFPLGGEHYEDEMHLGDEESTLVFERPSGEVRLWSNGPEDLRLERTGTFPVYVRVRET